ncbi:MAG: glycosyltransferase family 2 protein [Pseudohongiella sp.]|nr:glycosyltransferase family 2 protein [Pseudohongiella sp.]
MIAIFWISALLIVYTFVGYPLVLVLWARAKASEIRCADYEPDVSVLIIARNEEASIGNKLTNILAMDYPAEKLQIVVASDASTDRSNAILSEFETRGVKVVTGFSQRGKPANLNECVPELSGEIVVLMDARQNVGVDAIRAMVRNFKDPLVGAVSGELMLIPQANDNNKSASNGVGFYWRYEKFMRRLESEIDSCVGATGALYAIRKRLFHPIASDTLLDDFLIPMNIVRQGYRVVFEPAAIAWDAAEITAASEFRRKTRTIAGNFQIFARESWLLDPWVNRLWIQTISHKFFRLTAPVFLLLLFITNVFLLTNAFFVLCLVLQLLFYGAALVGHTTESRWRGIQLLSIPYAFCVLNWATVIGFSRFLSGRQKIVWK